MKFISGTCLFFSPKLQSLVTMRFTKQKRHRKMVRLFRTCFGFREPFKVLCDGTFVHHLVINRIVPADQAISTLLGGPVKLYTTRCILAELKRFGRSHSESLDAAHNLMIASCEHEKVKAGDACLMELIGETNQDHFFVATQDGDMRKKFQEIPGVPALFGLRNSLFLDPMSPYQRQFVKNLEEKRSHMSEVERNLLEKRAKSVVSSGKEDADSNDANKEVEAVKKPHPKRKGLEVQDRAQFKRKRAKGPNPLSCKKKKKLDSKSSAPLKQKENGSVNSERSKRKRTRSKKKKQGVQADG